MSYVDMLCIANLHPVRVPTAARNVGECPECGCRHFRLAGRHGSQPDIVDANLGERERLEVKNEVGRHKVGGDTWLGDKKKFVELVMSREPATSPAELSAYVQRWFGERE